MNLRERIFFSLLHVGAAPALSQPLLAVPAVNAPCDSARILVGGLPDTVSSVPDSLGFVSIFDGKSLKGWWENCQTMDSSPNRIDGAFWIVDTSQKALYTQQTNMGAGSVLMTNKKYSHYELVFDYWPSWGNDAGVFNRVEPHGASAGSAFQTVLDYISGGSVGGAYSETNYGGGSYGNPVFYQIPFLFSAQEGVISVTSWTSFTAARNPASFGCPASGCTASNWAALWDTAGWNQIRIKFYGGIGAGSPVKMKSWFRRVANPPVPPPENWVPVYDDSMNIPTPENPIGIQTHGTSWWDQHGRGNWYRNIRIRPLDSLGVPIIQPVVSVLGAKPGLKGLRRIPGGIALDIGSAHRLIVRDATGRLVAAFSGPAGRDVRYVLPDAARGVWLVEIVTVNGTWTRRVAHP